MKAARFDYARPADLPAALALLAEHGAEAAVLAGGQSLMPMLNLRVARPAILVDVNRIPGLDVITLDADRLTIGARARHADVLRSPAVRAAAPLITEALGHVAHAAIRNRGTFGGSLALADPAAELPACCVCLDATIVLASLRGERRVPAAGFFEGLYATARAPDELLVRIELPVLGPTWRTAFLEVARRHGDYAMAGLALAARLDGPRIIEARLVPSGIEPAPRRLPTVEAALRAPDRAAAHAALRATLDPMHDDAIPAPYRAHLAATLLDRALDRLMDPPHAPA